jgi:hypothetical protein
MNLGSREQALGIDPISKAILQMHVTQITAASAEESAAVAEELTTQSRTLRRSPIGSPGRWAATRAAPSREHFRHGISPRARAGGGSPVRRESSLGACFVGCGRRGQSQSAQPKGAVALRARFEQNAIPLDEEF